MTVGLVARPHLAAFDGSAAFGAAADMAAVEPQALSHKVSSVGLLAPVVFYVGLIMYCTPFLLFGYNHAKGYKDFVGMMEGFGLPLPSVFAVGGLVSLLLGPVLLLTLNPLLVFIGSKLVGIFLIFSTYFGHIIPLKKAEPGSGDYIGNFIMVLKNTGLLGIDFFTAWDLTGPAFTPIHKFTFAGVYFGLVLYCIAFIMPCVNHAKDFKGFVSMMEAFGLPQPQLMAVGGLLALGGGSVLILLAQPLTMALGALMILSFLIGATYLGHYKPMKAATVGSADWIMHFLNVYKNVGLMGGALIILGLFA